MIPVLIMFGIGVLASLAGRKVGGGTGKTVELSGWADRPPSISRTDVVLRRTIAAALRSKDPADLRIAAGMAQKLGKPETARALYEQAGRSRLPSRRRRNLLLAMKRARATGQPAYYRRAAILADALQMPKLSQRLHMQGRL